MTKKTKATAATEAPLPPGVLKSDTEYPKNYKDRVHDQGDHGTLLLYYIEGRKKNYWAVTTLIIGPARERQFPARYYVVDLDGNIGRAGGGPHVKQQVTLYLTKKRMKDLQKYVDLYNKGAGDAGQIRDRIGSRRAEGQLRRAAGERFWWWTN